LQHSGNAHLLLAGEANGPELYDLIHAFCEANGLNNHITEIPFCREMPKLYAARDVLISPAAALYDQMLHQS
jgi:hypothetical protein